MPCTEGAVLSSPVPWWNRPFSVETEIASLLDFLFY